MQISIKIVNLVIITLIYVSVIECQPYRGNGFPIDDIVAAIATAAMNGALPLHKMNLGNPNRKGEGPLRIPILLIRPNDLKGIKSGKMRFSSNDRPVLNGRGGPRNSRDFYKKGYWSKPKFPTHGLKVIPAPKLEVENKKGFEKKIMNTMSSTQNERDRDLNERFEGNRNHFNNRLSEEQNMRNRLNSYHKKGEGFSDKQLNQRLPVRQPDNIQNKSPNTFELPEKESDRPFDDEDYDYRGGEPLPPPPKPLPTLKPIVKVPTIIRHVYGAKAPNEMNEKPTIPPRYLKGMSDIPSPSSSSQGKYDDESDDSQQSTHSRIPAFNQVLPPISEQYKSEPVVSHKSVYLGDVYRKANSEEEEEPREVQSYSNTGNSVPQYTSSVQSFNNPNPSTFGGSVSTYNGGGQSIGGSGTTYNSPKSVSQYGSSVSLIPGSAHSSPQEEVVEDDDSGPLAGYAKDQYDKQLVSTLTKLMASSKNRSPLNIGGLETGGSEAKQSDKPVTKTTTRYYNAVPSPLQKSSFRDNFYQQKSQSNYNSNYKESIPQSQSQYSSQTQINTQSRIPESYLSPVTFPATRQQSSSGSQGQGSEIIRKPVSLDEDYNSGGQQTDFDDVADEYSQTFSSNA